MVMLKEREKQMRRNMNSSPFTGIAAPVSGIIILCLFLLFYTGIAWAKVTASTDRNTLSIDETITLKITSEDNSGTPDLTEIESDFQIMGRGQSQNYSMINGHASHTNTWSITLLPKKTGTITIPAIKVGNETTHAISLVIQKQSSTPAIDGKDVFLKITLSSSGSDTLTPDPASDVDSEQPNSFYVQQQIILTVRLFHRIRFSNATLSDLALKNTVVEKLGNDAKYSKVIASNRYNIIERRYAIYPQQSGKLIIPAMTFSGNAEISQNFSLFSRPGRQIISRTKAITLDILPIPESYTGKIWLPAKSLEIESEIIEDTNLITEGEAFTRHIVLRAKGLLGSQLPTSSVASSKTLKTYPDKEKLSNQLINGDVVGVRRDTVAIIPLKAGPFTLPEIKIDWWNTKTNQQETSHLAAQTFLAQQSNETTTDAEAHQPAPLATTEKTIQTDKPTAETVEKIVYKEPHFTKDPWFWLSVALLIIWMITLALLIAASSQKKKITKKIVNNSFHHQHKNYLQAVYDACLDNDANKASQTLIQWAKDYFQQPMLSGLSAIIQITDDESLNQAINELESSQYSQDKHSWDGKILISVLKHFIEQNKTEEQNRSKQPQAFSSLNP